MEVFLALVRENAWQEVLSDVSEGRNFSNSIQEGAGKEAKSNRYQFSVHLFASESCTKQQHQRAPAIVVPLNMAGQVRQRSSNAHCRDLAVTLIPASLEGAAATELSRMQSTSLSWGQHTAAERTKWQHFLDRGLAWSTLPGVSSSWQCREAE